jgi:hypothetical protein
MPFKRIDHRKISSTNILERLNREIRRRTAVVGVFPNMDSYIRLITTYLIEYSEEWSTGRSYIKPEIIQLTKEDLSKVVVAHDSGQVAHATPDSWLRHTRIFIISRCKK